MIKIGMVGVGAISGIYLKNLTELFKEVELTAVCDLIRERAEKAKEEYKLPKLYDTMYDMFADEEIDIILNLTRPYEHYEVTKEALKAGKHVYSEKPLAASWEEGSELVELAKEKNRMLGGAPDTFLGAGIQTCRKLIDGGFIGKPIGVTASMLCHGHESWHPDPEFYYQYGGGPLMDMGPYYITALTNLLGGVKSVTALTRSFFKERTITSQPYFGKHIKVEVPTYDIGLLEFDGGAVGSLFTSFDVYNESQAFIQIFGTEGSLRVPDPNGFEGPVYLLRPEEKEPRRMPLLFDYSQNSRGLGLADMAKAIETGRKCRTTYLQTRHVLEVMTAFEKSSDKRAAVDITTKFTRELPMVRAEIPGVLD